jgi:hypothetical protein
MLPKINLLLIRDTIYMFSDLQIEYPKSLECPYYNTLVRKRYQALAQLSNICFNINSYCSLSFEGIILNMRDTFGASYWTHGAFGYLGTQLLPPVFNEST